MTMPSRQSMEQDKLENTPDFQQVLIVESTEYQERLLIVWNM